MAEKRLNIGLLISDIENSFDGALCLGAMAGAKENDVNLTIVPGKHINAQYQEAEMIRYRHQFNSLFSYAKSDKFDFLLISMGSICTVIPDEDKRTFLAMFNDTPIMLLASEFEGYPSVTYDNTIGLREGINRILEKVDKNKIGFVSGPINNKDACERLEVYRSALEENGVEYDESKVVYGNFSEFSEDCVRDLMRRHPDLQAVIFANDQMAIGGYTVFRELDLSIGEDILVMGFDDSPMATNLIPFLTTVRADAEELGRIGISEAITSIRQNRARSRVLETSLVERDSTGKRDNAFANEFMTEAYRELLINQPEKAAELLTNYYLPSNNNNSYYSYFSEVCTQLFNEFFRQVDRYEEGTVPDWSEIDDLFLELLNTKIGYSMDLKRFIAVEDNLRDIFLKHWPDKIDYIGMMVLRYTRRLSAMFSSKGATLVSEMRDFLTRTTSLTKDMLAYDPSDDIAYLKANERFAMLGIKSAYIYTFAWPLVTSDRGKICDWSKPDEVLLKSFYCNKNEEIRVVPMDEQRINTSDIIDNKFTDHESRHTYILHNLFINEEQYGLLMCELSERQLYMLYPLVSELAGALKLIYMLNVQMGIQKQLENSLAKIKENNELLESISKKDELTGIYNRRGFFEKCDELICKPINKGKLAILIFADLDNLKLINDRLGHDDGDYALRACADILKESMRASDIVARIGGDEFAALAITESKMCGEAIYNRIKECMVKYNEGCEKPYYIGISVGYAEFNCSKGAQIEKYLDDADGRLYVDKKKKRLNIMKAEDNK